MMPVRFKRVAEAFGEAGRVRKCESGGSEHSGAESLTDLSDLVNSFLEWGENAGERGGSDTDSVVEAESKCRDYYETREGLKGFFGKCIDDEEEDAAKTSIVAAVETALREVGNFLSGNFKRRLMARLRYRGFDAGLCKSKWEKTGRCTAGYHEYIDVLLAGNRYIVEVSLGKEFEIARPTGCYAELLNHFPPIFVGKPEELKKILKLMCKSMKNSMKTMEMHIPPWRRMAYVHAKWFSSYRRTTNESAGPLKASSNEDSRRNTSIGFVPSTQLYYVCREGVGVNGKCGLKMGNLAAALQDNAVLL